MFENMMEIFRNNKPSEEEKRLYALLSSKEGTEFMNWLRKRTIEKQIGHGVTDGQQTSNLTFREIGRCDVYHELNRLIIKVSSYVNRE